MNRAYSIVEVKSIGEDERIIEGMATTPATDRSGDIVEPLGVKFALPMPALLFHDSKNPVATVEWIKPNKDGIPFRMRFPKAGLLQKVDDAFTMVKAGLIRAVSIGFREIESSFIKETGGIRFTKWELLEISLVSVPANSEATITSIKSLDDELSIKSADDAALAALGNKSAASPVRLKPNPPGVSGTTVKVGKAIMAKTLQEQIASFEAKRAASAARMSEIMQKSFDEDRTLEAAEVEEHDRLAGEIKSIDEHLVRLKAHEAQMVKTAEHITVKTVETATESGAGRSGPITVKSMAPKGIGVARMAIALANARDNGEGREYAARMARKHWPDSPEVEMALKAAVEAGDTTTSGWASQLVPSAIMQNEFLELLRPATIIGRIPGFRNVPFNISVPVQSGGGTYGWVGESRAKPATSLTFTSVTLRWAKAAGIIAITQELAKFSGPSAEMIVRDDMINGITRFLDLQFVDPGVAAVSNVSPASITNLITPVVSTGATAATFRTDMNNMLNNFTANNVDPTGLVLLMSASTAIALSLMVNALGQSEFPNISVKGGTILGLPIVVSENVSTNIIALNPRDILLAQDNGINISVSDQASVEMSTTPVAGDTSPSTGAVLKSFWQNNLIGLRAEIFITWLRGRTAAVEYISGVSYAP